jgi:putative FmdB family regulatory protein
MPLYDYGCTECGAEKEVQHTVSEIGKIEILCDVCGKPMNKLLSVPALIGFDNVGRSGRKKDNEGVPKKESTPKAESKKGTPAKEPVKKDTSK